MLVTIIESLLFVTALSTDAMIASFAYGSNKIKIPFVSVQVIAFICTAVLAFSFIIGTFLKAFIPEDFLKGISFSILFFLGITRLLDNLIKAIIKKSTNISKEIKFNLFDLHFILNIYANPKEADFDKSKILSPKEAASLAIALSIDSLAAGIGAALGNLNIPATIIGSFLFSMAAIKSGENIGYRISSRIPFELSWISGILLIGLAYLRLK